MPAGSASKARTAAALSPSTSMMSRLGAPRAKEISCMGGSLRTPVAPLQPSCATPSPLQPAGSRRFAARRPPRLAFLWSASALRENCCPNPDPNDVAHTDHPEHVIAVEHDQVPEPPADHRRRRFLNRPRRPRVDDLPRDVIGGPLGIRIEIGADSVENVPL